MLSFFERVYHVVCLIPRGQVATYGQIAAIVSHRGAARTVGWALHAIPEDSETPWHRVVSAQGNVTPFVDERGVNIQQLLLEEEGVDLNSQGQVELTKHQWEGLARTEIDALRRQWQLMP